jgi:pilus assembly protein CpaF
MSDWDIEHGGNGVAARGQAPADPRSAAKLPMMSETKSRIHRKLLERLNLSNLDSVTREEASQTVRQVIQEILNWEGDRVALNLKERDRLASEILDEIFGLGPLEPLMKDADVSDILVNTYNDVWIEKDGKLYRTDIQFQDDRHLLQVIDRIVSAVGRRIDDSSPMCDARLPDNSRVNAIIPPLAVDGPHLSIRRFKKDVLSDRDLMGKGTFTESMLEIMKGIVRARLNVLISGGTGAGKTTLLNVLSSHIPGDERIVTVEDSAELQLRQPHVVRLETRPPNIEGRGEVTARALVINSLRMRPDRIIVGEVRGSEAIDMLQAMNTGHDGSLTTIHANTPRDALNRLATMVAMANLNLPERAVRQQIANGIQVVVQVARLPDGTRKLVTISEIVGMEGDVITMQELFTFERRGLDERGNVLGEFRATGIRPKFADVLLSRGIELPGGLFFDKARVDKSAAQPASPTAARGW